LDSNSDFDLEAEHMAEQMRECDAAYSDMQLQLISLGCNSTPLDQEDSQADFVPLCARFGNSEVHPPYDWMKTNDNRTTEVIENQRGDFEREERAPSNDRTFSEIEEFDPFDPFWMYPFDFELIDDDSFSET
jgi:hypothetical protein